MQPNNLKVKKESLVKPKKRVGRGGKRGTYSGRGLKGQKARAGHSIRPAERDLIKRIPKLRGYKNRRTTPNNFVLSLNEIESFKLDKINSNILKSRGLVKRTFGGKIKILGQGKISRPVTISPEVMISKSALVKIESAGGKQLTA